MGDDVRLHPLPFSQPPKEKCTVTIRMAPANLCTADALHALKGTGAPNRQVGPNWLRAPHAHFLSRIVASKFLATECFLDHKYFDRLFWRRSWLPTQRQTWRRQRKAPEEKYIEE